MQPMWNARSDYNQQGAKYQKQGVSTWAWHITTINKYGMIGKSENAAPKVLPVQNT